MTDWTRDTGGAGGFQAETDPSSDYRIREAELRLDRRLAAMEAQHARMRWTARLMGAGLVVTLGALAVVFVTVVPDQQAVDVESVTTREVVLRDADGVARGLLSTDAQGRALLALSDQDGRERIRLTVLADGSPGVTISDSEARPRAVLGYLPDGTTNLVFADAQGISRAVFGLESDGSTQALFTDGSGSIRTLVGVDADGVPSVSTYEGRAGSGGTPAP